MGSISDIISDLKFGRLTLLKSFEKLSYRERTEIPVYDDWTIKDILAHIIGWDQKVIKILPLIVQDRANEIPGVDTEAYNQKSKAVWHDKPFSQILAEIQVTHQQIVEFLSSLDHIEIDKRHDRHGRVVTIRGFVIDIMLEHERKHALEIEQWYKDIDQAIAPAVIRKTLLQNRVAFMNILDDFNEADVLDKSAVGSWSISTVVGHVADWERIMLNGAQHIYDPSQPAVTPLSDSIGEWSTEMAAQRVDKSWPENHRDLRRTQQDMNNFMAVLKPGDWRLRGNYPWPDYGTLAELIIHISEHYSDHIPALKQWYRKQYGEPNP